MAMPQRDDPPTRCALRRTRKIEAIKRLDALLAYAVVHNDEAEADRLRAELQKLTPGCRVADCRLRGDAPGDT